jgi:hypothetical protein
MIRGYDECQSRTGITDHDIGSDFKIWKCEHYVYCPFCHWKCDSVTDLKKHLESIGQDGRHICEGWFRYGINGINQALLEIKYYNALKSNSEPKGSTHNSAHTLYAIKTEIETKEEKMKLIMIFGILVLFLTGCICDEYGCYNCKLEPRQNACIEKDVQETYDRCTEFTVYERYYDETGYMQENILKLNKEELTEYCSMWSLRTFECYPKNQIDDHFEVYMVTCTQID